jgi:hypothetical protein
VRPTLGALPVTDIIQTLFLEVKIVHDIEPIQTLFPELKAIQVNELMSLGRRFPDVTPIQVPAAIGLCMIFLDPVNQRPPPSHRPEFDPASSRKGANDTHINRERWAKRPQKVNHPHRPHFNKGYTGEKNTKMNMKKSIEATMKLNMHMNMQVKMKMKITIKVKMKMKVKVKVKVKMKMKTKMNLKRNMNMKINMNENMNDYEFGHECHDACEEECGLLTWR